MEGAGVRGAVVWTVRCGLWWGWRAPRWAWSDRTVAVRRAVGSIPPHSSQGAAAVAIGRVHTVSACLGEQRPQPVDVANVRGFAQ